MKFKICAPDGIDPQAKRLFEDSEFFDWMPVESSNLHESEFLIVRSATKVNHELLSKAAALKVVIRAGVGTDNIDFDACELAGVAVWNAPEGNFQSTAELALGMIFSLFRRIPEATRTVKASEWNKAELSKAGRQLAGSNLGVVGLGNIGLRLARMAKAIGMNVVGHDPFYKGSEFEITNLQNLFASSDVISVHLPLLDSTKGIVSRALLDLAKPGLFFVNTARGGLVNEADLIAGLESGRLGGVGLDVFSIEPLDFSDPVVQKLLSFKNVVLSPHIGAATMEAQKAVGMESWQKATRIAEDLIKKSIFRDRPLLMPKQPRSV